MLFSLYYVVTLKIYLPPGGRRTKNWLYGIDIVNWMER